MSVDGETRSACGRLVGRFGRGAVNILVLFLTLVVCGVVLEVGLRAYLGNDLKIFPRFVAAADYGPFKIRQNRPGSAYRHASRDGEWQFRVNNAGFRGSEDVGYEKEDGVFRVLVLGDSHTFGYEVQQDQTYAQIIGRYLTTAGLSAEVLNAGVSGFGTAEALVYLREEGWKYEPDAVVLGFASNDYSDNVRADLFRERDGDLVVNRHEYAPATRVLRIVNVVPAFRWLSQHSYAYVYFMNWAWGAAKKAHRSAAVRRAEQEPSVGFVSDATDRQERLASRLIREIKLESDRIGALFVLVDIPHFSKEELVRTGYAAPLRSLPATVGENDKAYAAHIVETAALAEPWHEVLRLFWRHGDRHISPYTHLLIGQAVGRWLESGVAPAVSERAAFVPPPH